MLNDMGPTVLFPQIPSTKSTIKLFVLPCELCCSSVSVGLLGVDCRWLCSAVLTAGGLVLVSLMSIPSYCIYECSNTSPPDKIISHSIKAHHISLWSQKYPTKKSTMVNWWWSNDLNNGCPSQICSWKSCVLGCKHYAWSVMHLSLSSSSLLLIWRFIRVCVCVCVCVCMSANWLTDHSSYLNLSALVDFLYK